MDTNDMKIDERNVAERTNDVVGAETAPSAAYTAPEIHETRAADTAGARGPGGSSAANIISALDPDQLIAARTARHFGRRTLSRNTVVILWLLRAYVVVMLIIVVIQAWTVLHGGGQ